MPVNEGLAQFSDNLMVSATVVYALAMVGYLAEAAFGSRGRVSRALAAGSETSTSSAAAPVSAAPTSPPNGGGTTATLAPPVTEQPVPRSRAEKVGRSAVSLTVLAFAMHLVALATRGLSAGRVPWGNMYEFSTAGALAAVGVFLVLLTRQQVRYLGGLVLLAVVLTMGLAVTVLYTESAKLVPALDSYWLVIHVAAAVISAGIFTVSTAATVLYLLAERHDRRSAAAQPTSSLTRTARRLAAPETLDRLAYRMVAFGFPLWTFAVIAGAIWAEAAWGRYWGWDPKETWAFITWVVYAGYLHARATAGWRGGRAAVISLVGFAAFLFNYVGVNLFINGLHSYAGI